jgi:LuxR family quorum sensing-dependent transcriptional regulator
VKIETAVFEAAIASTAVGTSAELVAVLADGFAELGFDYFRVVEAVSDGDARVLRYMMGKVNFAWEAAYDEGRLAQKDPRLRRALISSEPFFLSEMITDLDLREEEQEMLRRGREFGIHESYVLPHRDADNRQFAVVLIGPGRPVTGTIRVAAHILSTALLRGTLRLEATKEADVRRAELTIRQLQCLEWSRRGKSSGDIGRILELSPRTVDEHFALACKALEVRTRIQAVSVALALGLLPYRAADITVATATRRVTGGRLDLGR